MDTKSKDYAVRLNQIHGEKRVVAPNCKTHFAKQPMKISKGARQYIIDDLGYEFLDCCGNIAHVGHCHPHVVHMGQKQMATLSTAQGFVTDSQSKYAKALLNTVPEGLFDTVLLVNSGSEAVDLAIRLAQSYTKRKDIICPQPGIFGHSSLLSNMNYRFIKNPDFKKQSWIHHFPVCSTSRGRYADSSSPTTDSIDHVRQLLTSMQADETPVACLLTETINTSAGNLIPPREYMSRLVEVVKEAGGVTIIDEVLTGLGRLGTYWWAFQHYGIVPDIIVCGRSLGNGQPLAAVMTSQAIACSLLNYANSYGGNPVSCAMGLAVLEVIRNERLLNSSTAVGNNMKKGLTELVDKHPNLLEVRGQGLCLVLDIVTDKESKKPGKEIAEKLSYRLRDHYRVLVPADGPDGNCLFINPPMCFTIENSRTLIDSIHEALTDVESGCIDTIRSIYDLSEEFQVPMEMFLPLKRKADDISGAHSSKSMKDYAQLD